MILALGRSSIAIYDKDSILIPLFFQELHVTDEDTREVITRQESKEWEEYRKDASKLNHIKQYDDEDSGWLIVKEIVRGLDFVKNSYKADKEEAIRQIHAA